MSTVNSEGTLRLFPAAFHIFWQASPRSFGTVDEEAIAEPKLWNRMVYKTADKQYQYFIRDNVVIYVTEDITPTISFSDK